MRQMGDFVRSYVISHEIGAIISLHEKFKFPRTEQLPQRVLVSRTLILLKKDFPSFAAFSFASSRNLCFACCRSQSETNSSIAPDIPYNKFILCKLHATKGLLGRFYCNPVSTKLDQHTLGKWLFLCCCFAPRC